MVLISIQPFALRKIFLVIAALLCFSALCFADPVLMAEHYAPRAGSFEAATNPAIRAEADPENLVRGVDLPSRVQRSLPKGEPTLETPLPDDSGDIFTQRA